MRLPTRSRSYAGYGSAPARSSQQHAVVASFLGGTVLRDQGLDAWGWVPVVALVAAVAIAAVVLWPWRMKFAVDARELYEELYAQAAEESDSGTLAWRARRSSIKTSAKRTRRE